MGVIASIVKVVQRMIFCWNL